MRKTFLNWSSGKDAAFALYLLNQANDYSVEKLVTTINCDVDRVSMHDIPHQLLLQQAKHIGISLHVIPLSGTVPMSEYNEIMRKETSALFEEGFTHSVFGDIFLEDLKTYREKQLSEVGLKAVFPLWRRDTSSLMHDFLAAGFKAITVCVNEKVLDSSFCGKVIDKDFLNSLPQNVDPCGENGEYHSFVFDGPIFKAPVDFKVGEMVGKSFAKGESQNNKDLTSKTTTNWDENFLYCHLESL